MNNVQAESNSHVRVIIRLWLKQRSSTLTEDFWLTDLVSDEQFPLEDVSSGPISQKRGLTSRRDRSLEYISPEIPLSFQTTSLTLELISRNSSVSLPFIRLKALGVPACSGLKNS